VSALGGFGEIVAHPIAFALSHVVAALDPREPRTVGLLDLGVDVDDEVRSLVRSSRGVVLHAEGTMLAIVVATPFEAVRCALELADRSAARDRAVRGGLHDGLMSDRRDDLTEDVTRVAAELADLAAPAQILVTAAVLDGMGPADEIEADLLRQTVLNGQAMWVAAVRRPSDGPS
jgi:class 3 adenylate cyclase